ncbi:MAG: hypothetical protein M0021_07735 [Clostridia bacterium]|nr:hypothetical protein [Clostridia bacterium]
MTVTNAFSKSARKKPRVKVFKSDGQPVTGALAERLAPAEWASPADTTVVKTATSPTRATPGSEIGTEEFLRGVAELRQTVKEAIHELDNLIKILEPLKSGKESLFPALSQAEKGQGINTRGLFELLKSPVVHNILGSLLSAK